MLLLKLCIFIEMKNYAFILCFFMLFRQIPIRKQITPISGEVRNLQVGGHKLKIFKIYLSIYTYVRGFRNFWVGLCPSGPYSGFATDSHIKQDPKKGKIMLFLEHNSSSLHIYNDFQPNYVNNVLLYKVNALK